MQTDGAVRRVGLTDGVRLVLKPEPDVEVVAITIFVRTGADVSQTEAAIGEITARALFFGSANRSLETIAASVAQVGGSLETFRARDFVAITCLTVPPQAREAIYLLSESLKNADFDAAALTRARDLILRERQERDRQPAAQLYARARERLDGMAEPDLAALQRVTTVQAQTYFRRRYLPAQTVIAVAGGFDAARVQSQFDNTLVDYDRAAPAPRRNDARPTNAGEAARTFDTLPLPASGASAWAMVAMPGLPPADPDYPALVVLHALLGVGHGARLFQDVRDRQGIGYEVGASFAGERAEPLVAFLQWDARRALPAALSRESGGALALLNRELDAIQTRPPTETELRRARSVAIGRYALRHERTRDRAYLLAWAEAMGPGFAFDGGLPRAIASVTEADVARVAKRIFTSRVSLLAAPPK